MIRRMCAAVLLLSCSVVVSRAADDYKLGPDSMEQPDVPKGEVTKYHLERARSSPARCATTGSTCRRSTIRKTPACVMVFQDGGGYVERQGPVPRADRLRQPDPQEGDAGDDRHLHQPRQRSRPTGPAKPRSNRSFEYDTLSDQYVALPRKGDPAGGRQEVQPAQGRRRPGHLRHQLRRHLRLHGGVGTAGPVQQGAAATSAASPTSAAATSIRA